MNNFLRDYAQCNGLICANCYKELKKINNMAVLCIDCYLQFIADGCVDIQCEECDE